MSNLDDALADLLREVLEGRDFDASAVEIASESGLNVSLLKRKFLERNFSPETAREKSESAANFSKSSIVDYNRAEAFLRRECEKRGLDASYFLPIGEKREIYINYFAIDGEPSCEVVNLIDCTLEVRAIHFG